MQMNACKRIKHSQPSALQSTCEHEDKSAKRYKRSVSKVFRSPKRANVSCNSHDQHFAIRCDLQRCKEPRDPSLMQCTWWCNVYKVSKPTHYVIRVEVRRITCYSGWDVSTRFASFLCKYHCSTRGTCDSWYSLAKPYPYPKIIQW